VSKLVKAFRTAFAACLVACADHATLHADLPPQPSSQPTTVAHTKTVWIARNFSTGMVMGHATLTTSTLTLDGERATLTMATRTTSDPGTRAGPIEGAWVDTATKTYTGRSVDDMGGTLELTLHDGIDNLALSCVYKEVSVAADDAVRVRSSDDSECGDVGQWSPSATTMTHAWVCHRDDDAREAITFGVTPGIEHLFVNDDCIIQGGGLRRIARDGSVAGVRGKR
jgi:hypothetical protein